MLKTKKSRFSLILFVLFATFMLLIFLTSCKSENSADEATTPESTEFQDNTAEINFMPEDKILPELPSDKDYGGVSFTFLTRSFGTTGDGADWAHRDLYAEISDGEPLNDAVFARNRKIEDEYNINIKEYPTEDWLGDIRRAVKAGVNDYDVVLPRLYDCVSLVLEGLFYDLQNNVPYIDLSQPWWSQTAVKELSIGNRLFFVQGDLIITDNDSISAMIFNKTLLKDAALDDPYKLVKENKWILEKLFEMSKGISKDLNGNGSMYISDDLFGCVLQRDTLVSFFYGAGCRIVAKDSDDLPTVVFNNSKSFEVLEKVTEFMCDSQNVVNLHKYENTLEIYAEQTRMINENRALFSWVRLRVIERLRGMEADFGVIPLPKYNAEQSNYFGPVNVHTSTVICVPKSTPDLERTGIILEALAAESRYTLQPAYYEINLYGKYIRDEESQEMLDIILKNPMYELADVYNFGGFTDTISHYPTNDKSDYVSAYDKAANVIEKDIEKIISKYESID